MTKIITISSTSLWPNGGNDDINGWSNDGYTNVEDNNNVTYTNVFSDDDTLEYSFDNLSNVFYVSDSSTYFNIEYDWSFISTNPYLQVNSSVNAGSNWTFEENITADSIIYTWEVVDNGITVPSDINDNKIQIIAKRTGGAVVNQINIRRIQNYITWVNESEIDFDPVTFSNVSDGIYDTNGALRFNWDRPYKSGWSIIRYNRSYQRVNGGDWSTANNANSTDYKDYTSLTDGYNEFKVEGISYQESIESNNATTTGVWVCYTPTNLAVNLSGTYEGNFNFSWNSSSYTNTKFDVALETDSSWGSWVTGLTGTSYNWTGLSNRKEYKARVRPVTSYGATGVTGTTVTMDSTYEMAIGWQGTINGIPNPESVNGKEDIDINCCVAGVPDSNDTELDD